MRERPILFSDAMVREVLAGAKTQTRRAVKVRRVAFPSASHGAFRQSIPYGYMPASYTDDGPKPGVFMLTGAVGIARDLGAPHEVVCPYGTPGDTLWVREAWRTEERAGDFVDGIRFRADNAFVPIANTREAADLWVQVHDRRDRWRPSIFLRPQHSRLTLAVESMRVERVQAISDADIAAEGVTAEAVRALWMAASRKDRRGVVVPAEFPTNPEIVPPRELWRIAWTLINGRESWDANPWVWVIDFRRVDAARSAA